jgi:hypothetical protein
MKCPDAGSQSLAEATLKAAIRDLSSRATAIFVREPLLDPYFPKTSDIDLLIFSDVRELLPQRLRVTTKPAPPVDLIWLPSNLLDDVDRFAVTELSHIGCFGNQAWERKQSLMRCNTFRSLKDRMVDGVYGKQYRWIPLSRYTHYALPVWSRRLR